jgi:hypothetical protein
MLKKFATTLTAGAVTIFAAGCDGDPLEPSDHPEAGGIVIVNAETEAVLATSIARGSAFDNSITVPVGGALEVEVFFLDVDDLTQRFLPDADGGESLRATIANTAIVSFDFHGDHADFEGLAAGTTTATFDLMHGGHSDYNSGPLTIVVQ